jgi:hypothetical protein
MTSRITTPTSEELQQRANDSRIPGVAFVSPEESLALFEEMVQEQMQMSAKEFIRRWKSGEYDEIADLPGYRHILHLGSFVASFDCPDA